MPPSADNTYEQIHRPMRAEGFKAAYGRTREVKYSVRPSQTRGVHRGLLDYAAHPSWMPASGSRVRCARCRIIGLWAVWYHARREADLPCEHSFSHTVFNSLGAKKLGLWGQNIASIQAPSSIPPLRN